MGFSVCVYAICKNEEKFARRWMESMREADWVVALDTGSSDDTAGALRRLGARVETKTFDFWRFDEARNASMRFIPEEADICVCTDLDEVFAQGWRAALESAWREGALRARYRYVWSQSGNGGEGTVLWLDKIHARKGYAWVYPVHEGLAREDGRAETSEEVVSPEGVTLYHLPDAQKSRAQYLPLLRLAVHERPLDARAMHYLGREYLYAGDWRACVSTLQAHLLLPGAAWREERCASLRYIARALYRLNDFAGAREALFRAIGEAPGLREPYYEMAALLESAGDWQGAAFMAERALEIRARSDAYISEDAAWNGGPEQIRDRAAAALKQPSIGRKQSPGT